ncbi:ubiquitin carboxyl-terminal hydrolase 8-like [Physella acuta]|uniref:ubiquitin carboxyl-terminal hydrolase 8-like n=1 Tax=Physella acuta TaxID=109671 RepID=UPI0027DB62B8|nr:ubiquitin carboxyl-terminal hydrolase 8-like [Physella acuta]XP_059143553.1 ubiquitin carboxyl-terminal hydrolase 8-like [Physella acuta]XP_059143554.1 ubiquitin carboxyl-terminal hydrolase 8-like [Physella acuta]XP_059143556.1 ubiquitin carboxyl-terminal hydrolase 8-like [Physella acuta]XP_059143557.1 ubiquitin carboxyl-terminal hydrolase 8-like [Physella acuta]
MPKKKELYMGKCLGDLHKLSDVKTLSTNNVAIIIKSNNKVFQDAEAYDLQGDEERAFVFYIKYFNLLRLVKSKPEYKKQKDYFDKLIGSSNQVKAIERAEKLAESLKERYDLKEAEAIANTLSVLEADEEIAVSENVKDGVEESNKKLEETQSEVTSLKQNPSSISSLNLCNLLRDNTAKVIIMDVRSAEDFNASHISHSDCISVPAEIISPGSTVKHISANLPSKSTTSWSQRMNADHIILLDWNSTLENISIGHPLKTLKDALYKFDTSCIIKSEPLVLDGGYESWLLFYPTLTTNPHVIRPSDSIPAKPPSPTVTLDFDYPDLDEKLKPKDVVSLQPAKLPLQPAQLPLPALESSNSAGSELKLFPQFDRKLKPSKTEDVDLSPYIKNSFAENVSQLENNLESVHMKSFKSTNLNNDLLAHGPKNSNLTIKNNLVSDISKGEREKNGGKEFQPNTDVLPGPDKSKVEDMEKSLKDLQLMKKKEEKDVAALLRLKKKLKENLDEEAKQQEDQRKFLSLEDEKRLLGLEEAKRDEAEKKRRMEEVEKLRQDRKKDTHLKDMERKLKEEEEKRKLMEAELLQLKNKSKDSESSLGRLEVNVVDKGDDGRPGVDNQNIREEFQEKVIKERIQNEEEEKRRLAEEQERAKKDFEEKERTKHELAERERARRELEEKERAKHELAERERARREMEEKERAKHELAERERARREMEEKERAKHELIERERARRELEDKERAKHEFAERERARRELEEKEKAKHELAERERARREMEERAAQKTKITPESSFNKAAGQTRVTVVPSQNLPVGWEKRLDPATNRYFYIDHNNGSTHWTAPAMPLSKPTDTFKMPLKEEPAVLSSRGLSRSHSSPNIKKLLEDEEENTKNFPAVNRAIKPLPKQIVRKRDLNPVYGNVGPALTGLRNLGNTCYMNSTIQCLNNTSPLVVYFLQDNHLFTINRESSQGMHGEVVDEFAYVIKALWSQQYRSITPRDLKNVVGQYNPMFAGYQQQDSQEFLTFLLDGLHEGLNEVKKAPPIPEQDNDRLTDEYAAQIAWQHHKLLHKSVIVELFQGQLKSTLTCGTCKKMSVNFQAFMFLSLPIPASSKCSLKDCIKEFLNPELMTGSSKWKCPQCKVERDSKKKIDIWKLPPILLIGLNRFYAEGMWMQKKTTFVDFPLVDLDFSPYIIGPRPRNKYSLYGISNHYGTMEGGHYTAFCRNTVNKKWYKFDDLDVYEISSSDVKSSAAFVLYYTSIDMPAPIYKPHL